MLEAALALLAEGRSVIPLNCKKAHLDWAPLQAALPAVEDVRRWWSRWPDANIGIALGPVSGLIRIDADGDEAVAELNRLGGLPETAEFTTPSGGRGWLLKHLDGITTATLWTGDGDHQELRVQSAGAYTVVPPSEGYTWVREQPIAGMPEWLLDWYFMRALQKHAPPTLRTPDPDEIDAALGHIPADDYDTWIRVGMILKSIDMFDRWVEWSRTSSKFVEGECERKWVTFNKLGRVVRAGTLFHLAKQHGWKPTRSPHEPITDTGFAQMLAREGQGRILHSSKWGWLAWDDRRWDKDDAVKRVICIQMEVTKSRVDAAIASLIRHLHSDKNAEDYKAKLRAKQRTVTRLRKHEDGGHMREARGLASALPELTADYREFDQHPFLLNCPNGTLDLKARKLRPHAPADKLTLLCPTEYRPDAECPRWDRFLREVFEGDEEIIGFVQRLLGYCITGSTEQHILPIWYGTGRNGKSTMVRAVIAVLGTDYATTLSSGYLAQHKNQPHQTRIASLHGKRFTADLETSDGMRLDEELVKRLTGGDEIRARRMREDEWSFTPTHKLILATNYEPTVRNQDPAIWGRILKVPFNACFLDKEEKGLDDTLAAEAPGILRWMVEGCYQWQDSGLGYPKAVADATEGYKQEQNSVKRFLDEMTQPGNEERRTRKDAITGAYKQWCQLNSVPPVGSKQFGITVGKLGVGSDKNYYHVTLNQ